MRLHKMQILLHCKENHNQSKEPVSKMREILLTYISGGGGLISWIKNFRNEQQPKQIRSSNQQMDLWIE